MLGGSLVPLYRRGGRLVGEDENGMSLYLQVDDDEEHYEGRDPGPGLGGVA